LPEKGYGSLTHLRENALPGLEVYSETLGLKEFSPNATGKPIRMEELQNMEPRLFPDVK
jgi:hypothetical protein